MKMPINNLEYLTKCPLCNEAYDNSELIILEEEEKRTTIHLTCRGCKSSMLAVITVSQAGIVSMGMVTDINKDEARSLYNNDAISSDKVIEVHERLKAVKKMEEII